VARGKEFEWKVALILFGVLFLGVSDAQLVPPLLSIIAQDLQSTPGHAGIIVTAYSLSAAVFALFAGPLSDAIGRKKVLTGGLALFAAASFSTYHVSTLNALVIVRTVTGFAAGTLSTCALSLAGDYYAYAQRGRAMGVLSMGYFLAFVIGAPAAALLAPRFGWQSIFTTLSVLAAILLVLVAWLPKEPRRNASWAMPSFSAHLRQPDRAAGIVAAFLTSGGLVGFITYIGAWLRREHQASSEQIAFVFMLSGVAAVAASPVSGWLSDHLGKRSVIVWTNLVLTPLFILVPNLAWGWALWAGIALLAIGASARQAPLHALTSEIVGPEIRGEYTAVRNASSQLGIATAAAASAWAFDSAGFVGVGFISAGMTLAIPLCLRFMRKHH
jgi:predicted MFS family arabinose efflux permease